MLDGDLSKRVIYSGDSITRGELVATNVKPEDAALIVEAPNMVELLVRFMKYESRSDLRVEVNRLLCRLERGGEG